MKSDRIEQAGAHAEARIQTWADPYSEYADGYASGHMAGVEWADANPQPTTITEWELNEAAMSIADLLPARGTPAYVLIETALRTLLIEVTDDE